MSETRFSQGPWKVISDSQHPANKRITSDARNHIAKVYAMSLSNDPVCNANATLIAAAPKMHEALEAVQPTMYGMLCEIFGHPDEWPDDRQGVVVYRKLQDALRKARGN
jgi:hypothetical protein